MVHGVSCGFWVVGGGWVVRCVVGSGGLVRLSAGAQASGGQAGRPLVSRASNA